MNENELRERLIELAKQGQAVCFESTYQGKRACRVGLVLGVTYDSVLIRCDDRTTCWRLDTINGVNPLPVAKPAAVETGEP